MLNIFAVFKFVVGPIGKALQAFILWMGILGSSSMELYYVCILHH